jgi:uncharacterized protein (DUF1330 family)
MSVYMIAEIEIKDEQLYAEYIAKVPDVVARYGGRYLVRGGRATPISGGWNPQRIVVLEFPSAAHLRRCFMSKDYLPLAPLREQATNSRAIFVDGCAPPD